MDYVDWFNQRRLHGSIGMVPPAEFEAAYYGGTEVEAPVAFAVVTK